MQELPTLEWALYGGQDGGGYRFLAQSTGFREEWLPEAERLCTGFGERPAGIACPRAIFAQPLDREQVAVVQVADQGVDDHGRPGTLAFYLVLIPAPLYLALGGDPFHVAGQLAPSWSARGVGSPLPCPQPAPHRQVADIQQILNVPNSATLLGSAQALLDGGRLVFERSGPDESLFRSLWNLLPTASRADYWPASFAFSNTLRFHALAVPRIVPEQVPQYIHEEQAGDYPEGKYEHDLQVAAEQGDQDTLDSLFARRSYREVRRIGLVLLAVVIILPIMAGLLKSDRRPEKEKPPPRPVVIPEHFSLPPASQFDPLDEIETARLTRKLLDLLEELQAPWPAHPHEALLTLGSLTPAPGTGPLRGTAHVCLDRKDRVVPEQLIPILDRFLGTPNPRRDPGPLERQGPAKRQIRVLLWKHGASRYDDRKLTPTELVEHLQEAVVKQRKESR